MTEQQTDVELVRAAAAGDSAALSELVERHSARVYGICLRYFRNPEDAEDATQETFVALLRRASSFQERAQFSTWLYRVATNACNDLARKRSRRPQTVPIEDRHSDPDHALEDVLASREVSADLRRALESIDDAQRRAVVLHDVGGWPLAEIADVEGVAVGTIKSRVHRGHARLAALLPDLRSAASAQPEERDRQREPMDPDRPPTKR